MSLRPTDDREYIRDAARTDGGGNLSTETDTTKVVAMSGGEGAALPPAGSMSREFTEVFNYLIRRFSGFFVFPYKIGRRIGGRFAKNEDQPKGRGFL
ncbi:MAG: hypothetical protein OTJ98_05265 [Dehalococcoidia bacterium]|nr:hypothetical protein [Dehalococcoidia bacterium]